MDWVELDDVKLRYIKISQIAPKYRYVDEITKIKSFQKMRNFLYYKFSDTFTVSAKNWDARYLVFVGDRYFWKHTFAQHKKGAEIKS